jgi:hypothetical protein
MTACGATIQYAGQQKHECTLPPGHKGPHRDQASKYGLSWTASIAVIPPCVVK